MKPFKRRSVTFLNSWFIALTCILGQQGKDWEFLYPDIPELLEPEYCHQN